MATTAKSPPSNIEFEMFIIGGLLLSGEMQPHAGEALSTVDRDALVATGLTAEDFHDPKARDAYLATIALPSPNLVSALVAAPKLKDYLHRCYAETPSPALCVPSAREVHRMAVSRQLIQVAGVIAQIGYEDALEPMEAIQKAELLLDSISKESKPPKAQKLKWGQVDEG